MQSLLNTQNPQPTVQNGAPNSGASGGSAFGSNSVGTGQLGAMGSNAGGGIGIAGVASKSAGHTIKVFNDQTDRSLWEFVYDMQKEAMANAPGQGNSANGGANNANGGVNGSQPGQGNSFPSTFGQNSNSGNVLTSPPNSNQ